jgi:hypothetical protein
LEMMQHATPGAHSAGCDDDHRLACAIDRLRVICGLRIACNSGHGATLLGRESMVVGMRAEPTRRLDRERAVQIDRARRNAVAPPKLADEVQEVLRASHSECRNYDDAAPLDRLHDHAHDVLFDPVVPMPPIAIRRLAHEVVSRRCGVRRLHDRICRPPHVARETDRDATHFEAHTRRSDDVPRAAKMGAKPWCHIEFGLVADRMKLFEALLRLLPRVQRQRGTMPRVTPLVRVGCFLFLEVPRVWQQELEKILCSWRAVHRSAISELAEPRQISRVIDVCVRQYDRVEAREERDVAPVPLSELLRALKETAIDEHATMIVLDQVSRARDRIDRSEKRQPRHHVPTEQAACSALLLQTRNRCGSQRSNANLTVVHQPERCWPRCAAHSRNPPVPCGTLVAAPQGMRDYPVLLEVTSPRRFDRLQLLLRVLFAIVLGWVGITMGWVVCGLFFMLPIVAAISVSSTRLRYFEDVAPELWRAIAWLLQLSAYMMLLVDRFPTGDDDVRLKVTYSGRPTPASALLRLLTSIPSGVLLGALWFASSILWFWGALMILVTTTMPAWLLRFQRGVLRWQARLVAYHASFVDEYPPFSFDTDDGHSGALHAAA